MEEKRKTEEADLIFVAKLRIPYHPTIIFTGLLLLQEHGHFHGLFIALHYLLSPFSPSTLSSLCILFPLHNPFSSSLYCLYLSTHHYNSNSLQQKSGLWSQGWCFSLQAQVLRSTRHWRCEFSCLCSWWWENPFGDWFSVIPFLIVFDFEFLTAFFFFFGRFHYFCWSFLGTHLVVSFYWCLTDEKMEEKGKEMKWV